VKQQQLQGKRKTISILIPNLNICMFGIRAKTRRFEERSRIKIASILASACNALAI